MTGVDAEAIQSLLERAKEQAFDACNDVSGLPGAWVGGLCPRCHRTPWAHAWRQIADEFAAVLAEAQPPTPPDFVPQVVETGMTVDQIRRTLSADLPQPCMHEWVTNMIRMPSGYEKPGRTVCRKCGADKPSQQFNAEAHPPTPPLLKWAAELVRAVCGAELARDLDRDVAEPVRRIALEMRDWVRAGAASSQPPKEQ